MMRVDRALIDAIAAAADAADREGTSVRRQVGELATAGLVGQGAPTNRDGRLPQMARTIADVAGVCLSTAFSVWAHRMTIEYLRLAATGWALQAADELEGGTVLGVTGMASAFKEMAGCGSLDIVASPGTDGGWQLTGTLRWATNLHQDSLLVTAARTDDGRRLVVGLPLDTPGATIGAPFDLLAMGSTNSSYLALQDVPISADQVLSDDFEGFLGAVRPTFLVLQSAMCLGLAERCLRQTRGCLDGVNESVAGQVEALTRRWNIAWDQLLEFAAAVGTQDTPTRQLLLELRLESAELASTTAGLELRTAGGRAFARHADVNRRFREAAFIPVQSPSETQLRWELAQVS